MRSAAAIRARPGSLVLLLALLPLASPGARAGTAEELQARLDRVERQLAEWQFDEARREAEDLLHEHPDLPAVQLVAGWVKFHLGEQAAARELVDRAAAAFGGRLESDPRLELVRATERVTRGFARREGAGGRVVVWFAPGLDEILVPDLIEVVGRTLEVVGADLGHRPGHPIHVQILPDAEALSAATGLGVAEIERSGTIAVCKYGRLMVTSPKSTLTGFTYLDTASHELVHLIISQKTRNRTPIWLHEALARYEETRWRSDEPLYRPGLDPLRQSRLARALAQGRLITFEQMHPSMALLPSAEAAELAFSEVYTVAAFLMSRHGAAGLRELLDLLTAGREDLAAIEQVYGLGRGAFVDAWLAWLRRQELVRLEGDEVLQEESAPGAASGERRLGRAGRVDLRDHFHLGQLLRARERTAAAVVEYDRARRKAGANHASLGVVAEKLGRSWAALGRDAEAREALEAALRFQPHDLEAHLTLAEVLRPSDPTLAWLHLREAVRLNPFDPRVQATRLQLARSQLGRGAPGEDWSQQVGRAERALVLLRQRSAREPAPAVDPRESGPAAADSGAVRILTRPWARVWLDWRDTGLTTPVLQLELPAGRHVLGLDAGCPGGPTAVVVDVVAGQTAIIDRDLCPPDGGAGDGG